MEGIKLKMDGVGIKWSVSPSYTLTMCEWYLFILPVMVDNSIVRNEWSAIFIQNVNTGKCYQVVGQV